MSFSLLKQALTESKFSSTTKQKIDVLAQQLGKESAMRIVESFEITQDDYQTWLDVILGYAEEEGININRKGDFMELAGAVLENDPVPMDIEMQSAVIKTLWNNYKAQQAHSKVQRAVRAREEEEQLKYALKKFSSKGQENEEAESQFAQLYKASQGMEEEQYSDDAYDSMYDAVDEIMDEAKEAARYGQFEEADRLRWKALTAIGNHNPKVRNRIQAFDFYDYVDDVGYAPDYNPEEDEEFTAADMEDDLGDRDSKWRDSFRDDEDWYAEQDADQNDLPFTDEEFDDTEEAQHIMSRGREMQHSRDLEDFDAASDEGMDKDQQIISRGRNMRRSSELDNFDSASKPKMYYAAEQEEVGSYSPFTKGQLVTCKKDGASYKVEIPDGPGDQIGIMVGGRIKMVPSKDLEVPHAKEEEESVTKPSAGKVSFLHDVLTGENSREHIQQLQKKMEDDGANAWTTHHAKMPKNPHPKGSLAYKAWQRGMEKAAKEIWAPKPVIDPKAKQKAKQKKK